MTEGRQADRPVARDGEQYHLHLSPGDLPSTVLLPGDPGRVPVLAQAGAETAVTLASQDERKRSAGRHWYFPELEL